MLILHLEMRMRTNVEQTQKCLTRKRVTIRHGFKCHLGHTLYL